MIALLYPTSREKLIQWLKKIWERLRETKPVLVSISQGVVKHLAEAAKTSALVIRSELMARQPTALDIPTFSPKEHQQCLIEKQSPL